MEGHNLVFVCQGGAGDQLCAEPVVRYAGRIFPKSRIFVVSEEKDFFAHLDVVAVGYDEVLETPGDLPNLILKTFRMEEAGLNCNLAHTVDFVSLSALGRQIPLEDKNVKIVCPRTSLLEPFSLVRRIPESKKCHVLMWNSSVVNVRMAAPKEKHDGQV